jgi:mannose-6-phosphate isomerase-like protein (cupin superfamily)
MRCVVTGHTPEGKAVIVDDTELDANTILPLEFYEIWGADKAPTFPDDGSPPPYSTYFPPVGGFRFVIGTWPPESVDSPENADPNELMKKLEEAMPGAAKYMEKDSPGMHTTDTIDFEYIISGEIWLELDDGKEVLLKAGDTVIQNGTRHAWHNRGSEPCSMIVCLIGAYRKFSD